MTSFYHFVFKFIFFYILYFFFSNAASILSRAFAFPSIARALHFFTFYYFDYKLIVTIAGRVLVVSENVYN